ncbi:MAG TPA: 2-amino-4-hydroxy-6-hydroxymethyldihydropteridine diphosphokinase [Egicoccus sp.]|nr:2-amino-4-hydroxy-6-hydroxymethyldihydropteridine diphosphokinase [Egicoccus sp.]HSK24749.1 2-amino-4-hydroxy-6-hydroxymethyldihydropteridine diphosphokinase [Egicoccus sp.]
MEEVVLGLGANVGDRLETLAAAVHAIDDLDGVAVTDVSAVYETPPWPPTDDPRSVTQEPYYNLALRAVTSLGPLALLDELQLLERAFGRDRAKEVRWGPRTLDIDVLLYGTHEIDEPRLQVPHPRLTERTFVLVPMFEIMPGGELPDGRRLSRLLTDLAPIEDIEMVVRLEDLPGRRFERPEGPSAPAASFTRPRFDPGGQP